MAKLRATIRPEMSTGCKPETSRLASESLRVTANTWTRHVEVDLNARGRLSVVVRDGAYHSGRVIVDIELPAQEGEYVDAFSPTIQHTVDIGTVEIPSALAPDPEIDPTTGLIVDPLEFEPYPDYDPDEPAV